MKKKWIYIILLVAVFTIVAACSSDSEEMDEDAKSEDFDVSNEIVSYSEDRAVGESELENLGDEESEESATDVESDTITTNRMIIHQAYLSVNVKNLEKTQAKIEEKVSKYKGYIVESSVYKEAEDRLSGQMTVRVPEKHFNSFLKDAEEEAADVLERNVTGEDITEQYIDLESRLKSKRVVEDRLLVFMDEAKKTEDLLKISTDLSTVQEEIETIVGKMKYFENQTDYSTIEIWMNEDSVVVPHLENKNLDTWEKTKKQLATSINFILAAVSGLIVFFIGNLPVIVILLLIGLASYLIIKRRKKN